MILNEKWTNRFINTISCIGTLFGLWQSIRAIKDQQRCELILSTVFMILFTLVIIFFNYNKKKYLDLCAVCNSMSLNNRLQSLRELILIKHRELNGEDHKYKIKNAKFYYILSPSKESKDTYDIHYSISFELCKPWFISRDSKSCTVRFFAITLATSPQNFISEIVSRNEQITEKCSTIIKCAKKNYTIRGESGSKEKIYSGLYEIITVIPPDIAKKKQIELRFSYDILGQIKKEQNKHSFTIIPHNYSSKMNKFEVRIQTSNMHIDNLELQRYGINGEFEIAELFIPCEITEHVSEMSNKIATGNVARGDQAYYTLVKPDMNSAYSVQFDLS